MEQIKQIVFLLLLLPLFINCQTKKETQMNWKFIDFFDVETDKKRGEDLDPLDDYNFNQILNYNKDIFFLIGDNSNSLEGIGNPTSVIYRSMNFGTTFEKISLGKGTIRSSCLVERTLFVVLEKETPTGKMPIYTSYLYRSDDFGTTWEKVQIFENRKIGRIQYYSDKIGVISSYDKIGHKTERFYTSDGGKTWVLLPIYDDEFLPMSNCYFKSQTEIWYVKKNGMLMSYNFSLKITPHRIVKSLPTPNNTEIFPYIKFNLKTQEPYVIYYEKESNEKRGFIYYLNSEEKIPFENGCGVIYGDMIYEHVYDEKNAFRSMYRWSYDMGKTWHEEVLEDFYLPGIPLKGYAEDGYVYFEVVLFPERVGRFAIGWPKENK